MTDCKRSCITLPNQGLIHISGKDAKKFLQGQLTCHLDELNHGKHLLAAHCQPQGRVLFFARLFQKNDDYFFSLPHSMVTYAITALKKYTVFYKVQIQECTDDWLHIGIIGKHAHQYLSNIQEDIFTVLVTNNLLQRYLILGKHEQLFSYYESLKQKLPLEEPEYWKYGDILSGIPNIYPQTSGKFLPHEINLHQLGAIHFDKGCYTGQEIIARMHYRGKLKNQFLLTKMISNT